MRIASGLRLLFPALLAALLVGCAQLPVMGQPPPAGALVLHFIDVGQGDSILVQSAGENYLIDGGRPEAGPKVVDFLRSRGVEQLDGVVATHPDADHIGGLADVLDSFPVETVYLSGESKGTTTFNEFLRAVRDSDARVERVREGYSMEWGRARADVIAPPPGELSEEPNDNSVAILLTFGPARALMAGDAEAAQERYMAEGPYAGPLTVLKVNHHGSNTSTTPLFLSRFRPQIAVIQVGENSYGHPTPQTLRRLKTVGARVFRNDLHGDITVTIKDGRVDVAVSKGG
ncbi:MBL fold metallo-hydrolase [Rubrobacter taiwanensis]|jgi:competence protein ComEC|uniref:MBL fold metallo-hydrolase n=1 Tax=Rubrobacter taiwanensis TaxID=185139 RepID=A0A4R1BFD3_9ACTN|nr:ComEC/Rec2 family competence protein [Rubrobacter taiwanensis]TCJ15860.1 MBL fold metallo-hydrolase [Rubrobacter taiwanensis]